MATSLVSTGVTFPSSKTQTDASLVHPVALGASYQGGYYIGTLYEKGYPYYIIASPIANQSTGRQWKTTASATSDNIGGMDGWNNTNTYLNNATHPAGQYCRGLNINGYTDWYLPSKEELNLMYLAHNALKAISQGNSGTRGSIVGYWSSSESDDAGAWYQVFPSGYQSSGYKTSSSYVRAVRRVVI